MNDEVRRALAAARLEQVEHARKLAEMMVDVYERIGNIIKWIESWTAADTARGESLKGEWEALEKRVEALELQMRALPSPIAAPPETDS